MNHLDDHFAAEAREHLEQLEGLLALPQRPDPEQLLRLAIAVRTSAGRAGSETVASIAERLEDAARSILSGNIAWSDEVRSLAAQTVADLKLLMRALNRWGVEEERRVRAAIDRWEEHGSSGAAAEDREGEQELPMLPGSPPLEPPPRRAEPSTSVPVVPISSLLYEDPRHEGEPERWAAAPSLAAQLRADGGPDPAEPASRLGTSEPPLVPITSLEYAPADALRAAAALRADFDSIARGDAVPERPLIDLVDELFGLLDLAQPERPPRAG